MKPERTLVFVRFVLSQILQQILGHGQRTPRHDFLDGVNADENKTDTERSVLKHARRLLRRRHV